MQSYYYNTNDLEEIAGYLSDLLTGENGYFDSVEFDTDHISFTDSDSNEVLRYAYSVGLNKVTLTAKVNGQSDTTIEYAVNYPSICYSIHVTDNAVVMLTKLSSSTTACLIVTKNNAGKTMVISSGTAAYYAWTYTDAGAPTSTAISNDTTKSQTELVPFGSNGGTSAVSYSPYAFWCHTAPAYPTTGAISYTFLEMADQTGGRYFCNGVWAVS
jgi:myo-inositol-hexaphosphate 3-phosphohydrolase